MKLTIQIECDNAAFCAEYEDDPQADAETRAGEVGRILNEAFERGQFVMAPGDETPLHDVNGNRVGFVKLEA